MNKCSKVSYLKTKPDISLQYLSVEMAAMILLNLLNQTITTNAFHNVTEPQLSIRVCTILLVY